MNIDEAVTRACTEPTLVKALSWIAIWEAERVVGQAFRWKETGVSTASHGGGWDTCFEYCFTRVLDAWSSRTTVCARCGLNRAVHNIFKGGAVKITINGETRTSCQDFQSPVST